MELDFDILPSVAALDLPARIARRSWYRMPEREQVATKLKLPVGTTFTWRRSIVRAGYWLQAEDMTDIEASNAIMARLTRDTGLPEQDILKVLAVLVGRSLSAPRPRALGDLIFDSYTYSTLKHIRRSVGYEWLMANRKHVCDADHPDDLRTFWYVDHTPQTAKVDGSVFRWIGYHYPASGGHWGHDGYDEYEPATFGGHVLQRLYKPLTWDWPDDQSRAYWKKLYVHPLDMEVS